MKITSIALTTLVAAAALGGPASAAEEPCTSPAVSTSQGGGPSETVHPRVVKHWIGGAVTKIFAYSPATREGIAKPCIFSDAGWARFSESMALRRFAHTADELQAQGSAVLSESPAILTRGIDSDGAYVWITEVRVTPWLATETTRIPAMSRTARIVITQAKDDRGDTVLRVKDPR